MAGITAVQGMAKEWVRCRLLTPITPETTARAGMARADRVPEIRSIGMRVHLQDRKVLFDQAYASASGDIDLSKDFYPFGEKPKFGDAFWLTLPEDFGRGGAKVTISVNVTSVPPSPGAAGPTPPVAVPSEDIRLRWEGWNGKAWVELGTSTRTGVENGTVNGNAFSDSTKALSQKGDIVFTLPPQMARFSLNGKTDYWIRVRIASGNYGVEGHFVPEDSAVRFKFVPANFTPPSIKELFASYDVDRPLPPATQTFPEAVITENDFIYAAIARPKTLIPTGVSFPSQHRRISRPPRLRQFPAAACEELSEPADHDVFPLGASELRAADGSTIPGRKPGFCECR